MNEEWAEFLAEIERRRTASYEVATDLSDEGKDAERAFGRVDAYNEVLRLISHLGAVFPDEPAPDFDEDDEDGEPLEMKYAAGTRVRFAYPDAGYPGEAEEAMKVLTPGRVYTIAWADIGQSRTDLNLAAKDRALGRFNSVLFEPVDPATPAPMAGEAAETDQVAASPAAGKE